MAQSSLATPPRVVNPTRRSCGGFQAGRIHIVPSWASASTVPQHPATGSSHSVGGRSLVAAAFVAGAPVAARARRRIYGSCCRGAVPLARDEKVLGIDLGTTTSVVATVDAGCPEVLPNAEGSLGTPSVVAYTKDGEILVGEVAKRQAILNPRCTFHSVKRFIGRSMSEAITDAASVPYSVQDVDGRIMLGCPNLERSIHPEEVSAEVLKKLKTDASNFLEARVDKAVISVPAYFNDCQRQATKDAARIAGLEVLRIANEPTMAAFAYGLERRNAQTLLVADLGGGTLDVSILQTGDGVSEVLRTGGDSQLGGRDFDGRIWTWLADRFEEEHGIDLRQDAQALQRLIEASEKAKIELSTVEEVEISLPYVALGEDGPLHLTEVLTRKHFEDLCSDLWHRCREPISKTIAETVNYRFLTQSVLVGGGSRMPAFQELVKEVTANKPINSAISPEDAVAVGCALQAAMICGEVEDLLLIDVTPLTLGVETAGGVVTPVVELNTAIPFKKSKIFTTSEDGQDEIEVKVYQGERIMAEDNKLLGSFRLLDIAPAPAGIPKIQVIFEIDLNGILTVTAYDWATRQTKSVVIKDASTMEPWEVDRLLEEADRAQVDDDVKSQQAQLLEDSRLLIKISEEKLAELASKIPDEMVYEVLPRVAELQVALEDDPIDFDRLKVSCEAVRYQMMLVGQRAYGKPVLAGGIPGPRAPRPPGGTAAGGSMPRGPIFTEEAEDASPQDTSPAGKDMRGKQAAVKKALDTWRRGQ